LDLKANKIGNRKRTRFGTWNVRTLFQSGKLNQLAYEANRLNIEILGISETRWTGYGEHKLASKQVFIYSGIQYQNAPHEKGVGILLSPSAFNALMEWSPVNERIIVARFNGRYRNISVVQCYAPTENAPLDVKETFYEQLTCAVNNVHKKDILILLGDFNAQLGSNNSELERIMGRHALGTMTENGELFTEFCVMNELMIGGSIFPHKKSHKVTWVSPDGATENQIDHICISRKFRRSLEDVSNKRSADIGSDHHLVVAEIKIKIARVFNRNKHVRKRFDVDKLKEPNTKAVYVSELRDQLSGSDPRYAENMNDRWNHIKTAFLDTSKRVLGELAPNRKAWMSDETWRMIDERREAKAAINRARTRAAKNSATSIWLQKEKEVKKLCKRDRRRWVNELADQAENAAKKNDLKLLYETTRKLAGKYARSGMPVRNKVGKLLTNEQDQLKRWHEHFNDLFTLPSDTPVPDDFTPPRVPRVQRVSSSPPSIEEIEKAIKSMKSNKAPGYDQITSEMLKADVELSAQALHPIFEKIWETEEFPEDWLKGILVKVPKKGDLSNCDNWRGIMLICIPVKVFCKVLLNRFEKQVDETLRKNQAGFRAGRSCVDHINTLRIIIEQINEYQSSLHLIFVDFKKAFDTLHHNNIWEAMERKGLPRKITDLIKAQYTSFQCQILHNGSLSEAIECKSGVRQGCILSPLIFLMVIDEVLVSSLDSGKRGIQWTLRSNDHLEDLDFADDIVLMSQRRVDMQQKFIDLQRQAETVGLKMNESKTKSMTIGTQAAHFTFNGQPIESVDSYTYLGSQITPDGGAREDVKTRIRKAQGAFAQLKGIWRSNQLSLKTKIRIFNSNVKSVLLYGCETWLVAADVTNKLQVFVNRCLRRILKIYWPNIISNRELHDRCNQDLIENEIKRRKWSWIGHTLRRDADNIGRRALDWNPQGSRRRGAPRRTWRRSLETEIKAIDCNYTWRSLKPMAENRRTWKELISTLCD
jgi:hypothetical protein